MCAQMIRGHRQARKTPPTTKPMNSRWMTTTTSAPAWYHMVSAHDAQRDLAVAAVLLDQREPQRQQGIDGLRRGRVAEERRLQPDGADEFLGGRPRLRIGGEEQVRAGHRGGEVLPAKGIERTDILGRWRGCREQRPAVELRRADPVHRVDYHLARQRRALLV